DAVAARSGHPTAGPPAALAGRGDHERVAGGEAMSVHLSRSTYAGHYGPTTGDRIRLADTELIIEIEKDFAVYGEEVQFGGGKVIRDSQGQSPLPGRSKHPPLDVVITNAVILDYWGIVKGDIGIADGRIVGVGKAGNPLIQP